MEKTKIRLNSIVAVKVYLFQRRKGIVGGKHQIIEEYVRFRENNDYKAIYKIVDRPENSIWQKSEISADSFIGRALIGRKVGESAEVNVGGLSRWEQRVGSTSGNHLKLEIVEVD
ncbi:MAG: GreA/GreB family elongation factor [Patescibacteria group bacterium]